MYFYDWKFFHLDIFDSEEYVTVITTGHSKIVVLTFSRHSLKGSTLKLKLITFSALTSMSDTHKELKINKNLAWAKLSNNLSFALTNIFELYNSSVLATSQILAMTHIPCHSNWAIRQG